MDTPRQLLLVEDDAAFARTQALLRSAQPIFEAGFRAEGALAFAEKRAPRWRG